MTARLLSPPRPDPPAAERIELTLPHLPEAMEGRSVLHISDLHVRRYRPWFRRVIAMCGQVTPDFVCMTGDYMTLPRDEGAALNVLRDLAEVLRPRFGAFASFGNHDSEAFKRSAAETPGVHWLEHRSAVLPDFGITFLGTSTPCDLVRTILHADREERRLGVAGCSYRVLLGHEPSILITCAEVGVEWALLGHTHGGQVRPGLPLAMHNSSGLPLRHSSGILRCRDSVGTISRGLGESFFDVRLFCPPQLPLYILRRGPLPGAFTRRMTCVRWW